MGEVSTAPAAVIFDVDGTLADSERGGHRVAFNAAFAAAGLPYRWEPGEDGDLLRIADGRQRIAAYLQRQRHDPPGQAARR